MKHVTIALALLCAACTPVITHAPMKSTPEDTVACASDLLGSMGYSLLDRDPALRAERSKHATFGHLRADYDRITVLVSGEKLHVRGETVAVGGGSAGGPVATWTSKELRADVQRITAECGGD
jgi:hypothetical protein